MFTVEIHEVESMDFETLLPKLWGGAVDNAHEILYAGKGDDFMRLLDEFKDEEFLTDGKGYWTLVQVNSWLWFGWHDVVHYLGLELEEDND